MNTPSSFAAPPSQDIRGTTVVEAAPAPLVLQMIPSAYHHQNHRDDQVQLATLMRSLVLDHKHPIALEIAGTDQQRCLLIRAQNQDDLHHVKTQLHARLPHATFVPLAGRDDPFHLSPGETVSVTELHAGQASYLPLQDFEQVKNGEDPILGILGALDALPTDLRAIAQIALVPAPPTWSQPYQRKALEHALEPERQQNRRTQAAAHDDAGAPSTLLLMLGALFLAGYFLLQYDPKLLPGWVPPTIQTLLAGKWQQVWSGSHHLEVVALLGILLFILALPLLLQRVWKRLMQVPMYDMHSVAAKTSRAAYHVRLRLYVIGPVRATALQPPLWHRLVSSAHTGWTLLRTCIQFLQTRQWKHVAKTLCSSLVQLGERLWQSRWGTLLRNAGRIGWLCLHSSVVHLRARQWKQAAKTLGLLVWLTAKGFWLLGKGILGTLSRAPWKQAAKTLCLLVWLAAKGFWLLGKGVLGVFSRALKHRWLDWREVCYQQARRRQSLARLTAAYRQYHLANGNYFVPRHVRRNLAQHWITKGIWWKGVRRSQHLLDVEALNVLWHVPADGALPEMAHFAYRRSRSRLLPPGLKHAQNERSIGLSEHAGHRVAFGIPADSLQSHMLIGGKSGEGKSTLIQHFALRSMMEHKGLILIDPHGDLAEQVLRLVPARRRDDVIFIDLSDKRFACGINPLDTTMARGRDKMISDLIKIFSSLWTSWGSRMEISFEYSLRTLYEANRGLCLEGKVEQQYTLLDIMALLTNESFCHALMEKIEDPFIRRWWKDYYDPLSLQMQRDRVDPVLSKVAKFESLIARHIVGQSRCSIDFSACIEQQKIILVKLAKGVIGEDVARILGATLLGFLNIALEEQSNMEETQRRQFPVFIDEFQTLDGVDWSALAELRKYGATFFLATQSLEYLRERQILPVVLANVKQLAVFRMSAEDAKMLHHELDVEPEDILHLESLTCYLKFLSKRYQHPTFSCSLYFPPEGDKEEAHRLREQCQRRFMRPVSAIDLEIEARLAREIGMIPSERNKARENKAEQPQGYGHAHEAGYRGRKSQEKPAQRSPSSPKSAPEGLKTSPGEISVMNWEETVGSPSSDAPDEEPQEDESSE